MAVPPNAYLLSILNRIELEKRTKSFALGVIEMSLELPRNPAANVVARQVIRSAGSVGANYREANKAESRADFVHKLCLVAKEAAESEYWLEIIRDSKLSKRCTGIDPLLQEAGELVRIFTAGVLTIRRTEIENQKSKLENES